MSHAGVRTAVYNWLPCNLAFKEVTPEKCIPYSPSDNFDKFKENLKMAGDDLSNGIDLTMIYFGYLDTYGHNVGPETPTMGEGIERTDRYLGRFFDRLEEEGLWERTNIIFVSDHGIIIGVSLLGSILACSGTTSGFE